MKRVIHTAAEKVAHAKFKKQMTDPDVFVSADVQVQRSHTRQESRLFDLEGVVRLLEALRDELDNTKR